MKLLPLFLLSAFLLSIISCKKVEVERPSLGSIDSLSTKHYLYLEYFDSPDGWIVRIADGNFYSSIQKQARYFRGESGIELEVFTDHGFQGRKAEYKFEVNDTLESILTGEKPFNIEYRIVEASSSIDGQNRLFIRMDTVMHYFDISQFGEENLIVLHVDEGMISWSNPNGHVNIEHSTQAYESSRTEFGLETSARSIYDTDESAKMVVRSIAIYEQF